ncbi:MAG: DivIVA domain-containing protein [Acidimicrobiales bacterium]
MDLTPQLLNDVAFHEAKKGYNTQEVDDFLERLAVGLERKEAQLLEAKTRIDQAEARVEEAERRAAAAAARASETSDADDTLKRTLVLAQRTADAAIKEAEEQAARTLSSAQDQAARMLADAQEATARARSEAEIEARQAQEEARARVLAELQELEAARDQLQGDVELLDRHLDDQRSRLRDSLRDLQRIVDDPSSLGEVPPPSLSDVSVPDLAPPAEPAPSPPVRTAPLVASDSGWEPEAEAAPEAADNEPPPPSPAYADAPDDPPTEPVDVLAERDADDDAYLAELRKAMTDDSPLGPREDRDDGGEPDDLFDGGGDAGRTRFGRRR